MSSTRVYVGNLSDRIKSRDLEDIFYKYGKILDVFVKVPDRGACYGFVEFDDKRDAEDAVRGRDGYRLDGYRIRCEFAKGGRSGMAGVGGGRGPQKSEFRVKIIGLPQQTSWQDIKDFIRKATDRIGFTDILKEGVGVVEFPTRDDMEDVLEKLDDTEFKNRYGDRSYVRIKRDGGAARSRSPSPARASGKAKKSSRSRSRSRGKKTSRSRSRSRGGDRDSAPAKKASRSRSRDRRRSPSRSRSASPDRRKTDSKARSPSRSRS